ncbi:MAG: NAD-dependent epimerase/dehydratase family protein, partial [Flavobacteriaceae bacterium]|nr:NAD-dependent epimerase/dehydratase family protein [Flavobacteriaceae bacterium]
LQLMKILLTGSSGFIGYHLAKELLKDGHEVIGIDNHSDYYDVKLKELRKKTLESVKFSFFQQDINNIDIKDNDIDLAINLAAQPGVRVKKEMQQLYQHTNVRGFEAFCNFCEYKNIKKIIYASSSSVYSDSEDAKYQEINTKLKPKSLYGESKLANEKYASKFSKENNISFIGLRFFSVYGPYGRPDMAYYSFSNSLIKNKPIYLNNRGEMFRDMTFISDIVEGLIKAIDYSLENNFQHELFNLGNDSPIKTSKLLSVLEKKFNKKPSIINKSTKNEVIKTHADITKAKNLLGYVPVVSFEEGIELFTQWYKKYENL